MALIPDVSNFQRQVDWQAVLASGRVGGICKATESLSYVDPFFAGNWSALGALNATRGAYHFARPGAAVAESQADKFLKIVGPTKPGDILVLDIEVGDGNLSDFALRWLDRVQAATGITPWLYSYGPFIRAHLTDPRLAAYPLWIAAYSANPPPCPPPWTSYVLWQHTDKANVPGISGPCDESTGELTPPVPPPPKVVPMHDPPLTLEPIVADLAWPAGGAHLLAASGALYAFGGAPAIRGMNGLPDFAGRSGAQLEALPGGVRILATSGEHYDRFP